MAETRESRPGENPETATRLAKASAKSSLHHRQDGYSAPTPDDRLDAEVIDAAKARGFRLAARCTRCHQWVVAAESVAAHMGPVCRAKAAAEEVGK
ncbi:MAG: hypothetical protein KDB56_18065 [Mycobacterium sp.]|nr:hypothetical protein [Mycobacterium sp.]